MTREDETRARVAPRDAQPNGGGTAKASARMETPGTAWGAVAARNGILAVRDAEITMLRERLDTIAGRIQALVTEYRQFADDAGERGWEKAARAYRAVAGDLEKLCPPVIATLNGSEERSPL